MRRLLVLLSVALVWAEGYARPDDLADMSWRGVVYRMPDEWYASARARGIADLVVKHQMGNGGWRKNIKYHLLDTALPPAPFNPDSVGATIDNEATTSEMRFLAKVYAGNPDARYRASWLKGLEYLLEAQYPNGGWPQFYPVRPPEGVHYSACITYNDNAYINVMQLLGDVSNDASCFASLCLGDSIRQLCAAAFERGVGCILSTQIVIDGKPTVWCAQHDAVTLAPAKARAYELPSLSGFESVDIVELLMSIPEPSDAVIASVKGAMEWFDANKIEGLEYERYYDGDGNRDARLLESPGHRLWARFYDLETGLPFFCDRDGIKRPSVYDIGQERRGGYSWYTDSPERLYPQYVSWLRLNNL